MTRMITSTAFSAPLISAVEGGLIDLLDIALGSQPFATTSVDSVVVVSNIAYVTKTNHGLIDDCSVVMGGCDVLDLNGIKTVLVIDASTYTYPAPGVGDGEVSGNKTQALPGFNWEVNRTSPQTSSYRSRSSYANRPWFYAKDTNRMFTEVWGMHRKPSLQCSESIGRFPQKNTIPNSAIVYKHWSDGGQCLNWTMWGDERTVYLSINPNNDWCPIIGFGEYIPENDKVVAPFFVLGADSQYDGAAGLSGSGADSKNVWGNAYTHLQPVRFTRMSDHLLWPGSQASGCLDPQQFSPYKDPLAKILYSDYYLMSSRCVYGKLPGVKYAMINMANQSYLTYRQTLPKYNPINGSREPLMVVRDNRGNTAFLADISSNWWAS